MHRVSPQSTLMWKEGRIYLFNHVKGPVLAKPDKLCFLFSDWLMWCECVCVERGGVVGGGSSGSPGLSSMLPNKSNPLQQLADGLLFSQQRNMQETPAAAAAGGAPDRDRGGLLGALGRWRGRQSGHMAKSDEIP